MCIQSLAWSKSCPAPGHTRSILYFTPAWEPRGRFMGLRNGLHALRRLSTPCPALGHSQLPGRWKMRFPRATGKIHWGKPPWLWAALGQSCHALIPQQEFQQIPGQGPQSCGPTSPEGSSVSAWRLPCIQGFLVCSEDHQDFWMWESFSSTFWKHLGVSSPKWAAEHHRVICTEGESSGKRWESHG